jgi:hypothetical protein
LLPDASRLASGTRARFRALNCPRRSSAAGTAEEHDMQQFTFSIFDGETVAQTLTEACASLREAGSRAFQLLSELVRADDHSWALQEWRVDVGNQDGLILITIGAYAREAAALKAAR